MNRLLRDGVILLSLAALQTCRTFAQDFYPLEAGNAWNYTVFHYNFQNPPDSASVQIRVLNDTLMPNGRVYAHLSVQDFLYASFVRADSNYVYYYSRDAGTEVPMYNLRSPVGTADTMRWGAVFSSRIDFVGGSPIFGLEKTVRQYTFDGLVRLVVTLADGFGIIRAEDYGDGGWLPFSTWELRGAAIRDTLYGTVVHTPGDVTDVRGMSLCQNYPNPCNPSTIIRFELRKSSFVKLCVYDMLGREVAVLVEERRDAGVHEMTFDGRAFSSGAYLYRLTAGNFTRTRTLVLMK